VAGGNRLEATIVFSVCIYSAHLLQSPKGRVFQEPKKPGMVF
jgi:hypothetical protein